MLHFLHSSSLAHSLTLSLFSCSEKPLSLQILLTDQPAPNQSSPCVDHQAPPLCPSLIKPNPLATHRISDSTPREENWTNSPSPSTTLASTLPAKAPPISGSQVVERQCCSEAPPPTPTTTATSREAPPPSTCPSRQWSCLQPSVGASQPLPPCLTPLDLHSSPSPYSTSLPVERWAHNVSRYYSSQDAPAPPTDEPSELESLYQASLLAPNRPPGGRGRYGRHCLRRRQQFLTNVLNI